MVSIVGILMADDLNWRLTAKEWQQLRHVLTCKSGYYQLTERGEIWQMTRLPVLVIVSVSPVVDGVAQETRDNSFVQPLLDLTYIPKGSALGVAL